jgi:hypothetical protein
MNTSWDTISGIQQTNEEEYKHLLETAHDDDIPLHITFLRIPLPVMTISIEYASSRFTDIS